MTTRRDKSSHTIDVRHGEFSIEDPWRRPEDAEVVPLVRSSDGSIPGLRTAVALYYDDERLYALFEGADDHVVSTHTMNDEPLYEQDVVEVFVAPEQKERYFELEVSPTGVLFDASIHSPRGVREEMETDVAWNCQDLFAAVRHHRTRDNQKKVTTTFSIILAIPFASLDVPAPSPGNTWAANFFRIDRSNEGDEFSAWSPTGKTPPDFHVTAAFGTLRFL